MRLKYTYSVISVKLKSGLSTSSWRLEYDFWAGTRTKKASDSVIHIKITVRLGSEKPTPITQPEHRHKTRSATQDSVIQFSNDFFDQQGLCVWLEVTDERHKTLRAIARRCATKAFDVYG